MTEKSEVFTDWMTERITELELQGKLGATEPERLLANKVHTIMLMVMVMYEKTHGKQE